MPKLQLGCGEEIKPGWVNLDIRPLPGVDVVCDARKLPFDDNHFDLISSNDVLEHIPRPDTLSTLKEWNRVLKPNGRFKLRVPNLDVIFVWYFLHTITAEDAIRRIFGNQSHPEDEHKTIFTVETIAGFLKQSNFQIVGMAVFPDVHTTNFFIESIKISEPIKT